jgi:NADH:ubiquinone oxidoreductase subunit 3 (subunit A)
VVVHRVAESVASERRKSCGFLFLVLSYLIVAVVAGVAVVVVVAGVAVVALLPPSIYSKRKKKRK